ncbi:hypothetical protein CYLTODRAFT_446108 [Cylindrobasidium torrendii FP15055 ss-10]|uniref:C2H2-type domain-containing protein n=1 Tax=Cylindrobasidium torrendii FP15055 ss-10 TaxID=1314674 RepID=A0A0D7B0Y0_9AGAR|nr:hypothetical protein CYLTODRAFT_446108 [Cylindrobasidium torrendii FP15055 ss-10]
MATMVATAPSTTTPSSPPALSPTTAGAAAVVAANNNGVTKRYRPAPAKTFQCRGYGECRMVFSRSEHLARHIRKHTGERPFTCHCGKQFSRLDNLRQHAQTVHADKQEENEKMMRELSALHATMSAASKARTGRRTQPAPANQKDVGTNGSNDASASASSASMRPGTSTGYEGGEGWQHLPTPSPPLGPGGNQGLNGSNHSFRSFREQRQSQSSHGPSNGNGRMYSQSFRDSLPPISATSAHHVQLPTIVGGTASRPTTAGGTVLPPLSSLVSLTPQPLLFRRPPTANYGLIRPGTAPDSLMVPPAAAYADYDQAGDSPFFFHPPGQSQDPFAAREPDQPESRPQSRRLSMQMFTPWQQQQQRRDYDVPPIPGWGWSNSPPMHHPQQQQQPQQQFKTESFDGFPPEFGQFARQQQAAHGVYNGPDFSHSHQHQQHQHPSQTSWNFFDYGGYPQDRR